MPQFCKECSIHLFCRDLGDFKGLCEKGECVFVTCDRCRLVMVDHTGLNVRGGYSGESYRKDT